jgi:hypothetical protein
MTPLNSCQADGLKIGANVPDIFGVLGDLPRFSRFSPGIPPELNNGLTIPSLTRSWNDFSDFSTGAFNWRGAPSLAAY